MKSLIWTIILFAAAIVFALTINFYTGNAYIVVGQTMLYMNLHLFIIGIILTVIALYFILKLLSGLLHLPASIGRFGVRRKSRQAIYRLNKAGLAYFEGKYQQAMQEAQKVLNNTHAGDNRVLALMLAAHSAEQCGDEQRRTQYLNEMEALPSKMQLSRHLLQAEVALNQQNLALAESSLKSAAQINPRLTNLVRLQLRLALAQSNAFEVIDRANKLKQVGAMNEQEWQTFSKQAYLDLLNKAKDRSSMKSALKHIPEEVKKGILSSEIAERYIELELYDQAVAWVKQYYPQSKNTALLPHLVTGVHYLGRREQQKAIDAAEQWLQDEAKNHILLTYLGEMAYGQKLWGKAQAYLEASLAIEATAATRLLLAKVLEESGNEIEAKQQRQYVLNEIEQSI